MMKKNKENTDLLISCLKSMKQTNTKSQIIFWLGAGFAKHIYDIPLWNDLALEYVLKRFEKKPSKLNNLETQLMVDFAEEESNFYGEAIKRSIKPNYFGLKKFYEQITKNTNILTKFITTNHCESVKKYFSINNNFSFDIKDMRIDDKEFRKIYDDKEIIINLHGSLSNENKIVKTGEYHNFFMKGYKEIFSKMQELNKENKNNIKQSIIIIFGSSLEEKHLISFLLELYKIESIFYINHAKVKSEIYSVFEARGLNYISTCKNDSVRCVNINECNDYFFKNIEKKISPVFSPDISIISDNYNFYNTEMIKEITNMNGYLFGKTFKKIDEKNDRILKTTEFPYMFQKNHFLRVFLQGESGEHIGKHIVNLYLYYFEKNNFDFWSLLEVQLINRGQEKHFYIFLQKIIINKKFDVKGFLNNYMQFNKWEKKVFEIFDSFFYNLNNTELSDRQAIIFNFYEQIIEYDSFDSRNIWFLERLKEFEIDIDVSKFLKKFEIVETERKYYDFKRKKNLIIFISKFLKIDKITSIFRKLIPELDSFKKLNSWGNNDFIKTENISMYMEDYEFINYIFIPYISENNDIILPSFEDFNPEKEFDSKITSFLLSYYYYGFPKYFLEIEKLFNDIKYNKKFWKIKDFSHGIVASVDANFVNENYLKQYKEKWRNLDISKIFQILSREKKMNKFIEHTNEKNQLIKEMNSNILLDLNWKMQVKNVTEACVGLGIKVISKPWNNWNFFANDFTKKYVEENNDITVPGLDDFFTTYFYSKYLSSQINNIYKFDDAINLGVIEFESFSKVEDVMSEYLFKQLLDLLNINSGNIYYIFKGIFSENLKKSYNPKSVYIFKIWQKIFENSKNISKLINRIINTIVDVYDSTYKKNVELMLINVFSKDYIPAWKKAIYFHFDSSTPREEFLRQGSELLFKDAEFNELKKCLETLCYVSKNSNIVLVGNASEILYVEHFYKRLFSQNCYKKTNLLYKLVFHNNKELLINSGRYDFTLFEINIIYNNFFNEEAKKFYKKIKERDLSYIWKIFLNLEKQDLKIKDINMLDNIHNSLKSVVVKKGFASKKSEEIIIIFIDNKMGIDFEQKTKEEEEVNQKLLKFKFCLLSITSNDIKKHIEIKEKNLKLWFSNEEEYYRKKEAILKNLDDFFCSH